MPNFPIHYRKAGDTTAVCGKVTTTLVNTTRSGTKVTCQSCHRKLFGKARKVNPMAVIHNTQSVIFEREELEDLIRHFDSVEENLSYQGAALSPVSRSIRSKVLMALQQLKKKNHEISNSSS